MLRRGKKPFELKHIISSGSNDYVLVMRKFILSYRRQFLGYLKRQDVKSLFAHRSGGLGLVLRWSFMAPCEGQNRWKEELSGKMMRFVPLLTQFLYCHCSCLSSFGFWEGHFSLALPKTVTGEPEQTKHALLLMGLSKESQCMFPCLALLKPLGGLNNSRKQLQ